MLRRWVPAGVLLSSVVVTSSILTSTSTIWAQTAPTKAAAPPTTAKAPTSTTAAKPPTAGTATAGAKAAPTTGAAKTGAPTTDAKAAAPTPTPTDAKAPATDPKAATPAPATDAEKELARLLDDAKKNFKAGQYDKAREQAAAAYKLKADYATLLLLAQAEAKSNKPRDAAEHVEVFLRENKAASADDRQTAQKLFEEVTAKLATWTVKVSVDGAEVYLDNKLVGKSPLPGPLFVDPNTHEVEARKEGFKPEKEMLVASPNTESDSTLVMKPVPVEVKPKEIVPKETPIPEPPPPPSPAWRTYGMIGGGALTVLGLGLGIGLSVSASGKGEEADAQKAEIKRTTPNTYDLCGPNQFQPNAAACAQLAEKLSSQDSRANGAVAGFVIAGVGAVGTLGLFLLPKLPFGRKLMGMQIAPVIGSDRMGGMMSGSF